MNYVGEQLDGGDGEIHPAADPTGLLLGVPKASYLEVLLGGVA